MFQAVLGSEAIPVKQKNHRLLIAIDRENEFIRNRGEGFIRPTKNGKNTVLFDRLERAAIYSLCVFQLRIGETDYMQIGSQRRFIEKCIIEK